MRSISVLATIGSLIALTTVAQGGIITITAESDFLSANPGAASTNFPGVGGNAGPLVSDPNGDWAFAIEGPKFWDPPNGFTDPFFMNYYGLGAGSLTTQPPGAPVTLYLAQGVGAVGLNLNTNAGFGKIHFVTATDWDGNVATLSADLGIDPTFFGFSSSVGIRSIHMAPDDSYGAYLMGIDQLLYTPGQGNLDVSTIPPTVAPVPLPPAAWMGLAPIFVLAVVGWTRRRAAGNASL